MTSTPIKRYRAHCSDMLDHGVAPDNLNWKTVILEEDHLRALEEARREAYEECALEAEDFDTKSGDEIAKAIRELAHPSHTRGEGE